MNDTRTLWKRYSRSMRKHGRPAIVRKMTRRDYIAAACDSNAAIRAKLDACSVNGLIGLITDGMDCDCSKYHDERIIPVWSSVAAFKQWDDDRQSYLDGPETVWLVMPDNVTPGHSSRDLALEAFEDGHPYSIHY
jgi:hypothetical protein